MKKFHQWLIGISLMGMLVSGIASASFQGGSVAGVSAADLLNYFKLAGANIATGLNRFQGITQLEGPVVATNDVNIDNAATLTGGTYSGMRLQTTERASYCIGPSDGFSKEFCLSGGGLLQLHGSNGSLYNGTVTGNQVLASDPGLNRHWWAPTGNTVMVGGTGTPETSFMVGSHLRNAATFLADTTNDWTKHLPISAPAAGECDSADEKGRMYFDSTANAFKYCNGTAWSDFGGGPVTTLVQLPNSPDATIFTDANIKFDVDVSAAELDAYMLTAPGGSGDMRGSCGRTDGTEEAEYLTTVSAKVSFQTATMLSGSTIRCVFTAENDNTFPVYYLTASNSGTTNSASFRTSYRIEKVTP